MLSFLENILSFKEFIPHGHCYLWKPSLVWLHILSDSFIALAYYSIPVTLLYFVRKRQDLPFDRIFLLFGTFIIACGTSHIMEVWTLWYPVYWLSGFIKVSTAIISIYTAIELIYLIPKALALPSPAQLEAANCELEREISERRQSESKLLSFFNSSSMMMGIVELYDNDILHLSDNLKTAQFFGTTPEQMKNRFSSDLGASQATRQLWMEHYLKAHELQAPVRFEYIHETSTDSKWLSVSVCPIANGLNNLPRFSYIIEDISDRKQTEIVLQQALSEAKAASIAKSRFLSNMSHELRTPLNAILGFSHMMVQSPSLSPDHKEQLRIINRSGGHLLNLINDILSISKIEAGQMTLHENSFDLFELLQDIEQMLKFKATVKGLSFIFKRAVNVPQYVRTDDSKLRQVLINLLENAIKFTNKGSVSCFVSIENQSSQWKTDNLLPTIANPQYRINFTVKDTGSGIASHEIETLFDPFSQTETGRQSMQGTGLGLPISREYVQLMGGEIAVSSQVDKGTSVTFDILVSKTTVDEGRISLSSKRVIGLQPNQPIYRILIVDDVEETRLLLARLLEPLGFQVNQAANGVEAFELWSTWEPHLILMDMRMPIMNGYEVTKQIKATIKGQSTVIIALTASAFEEERSRILSAGCDDFLRKPFQEKMFFDTIAHHLGVSYLYEDEKFIITKPHVPAFKELTVEDLSVMPDEWVSKLCRAVLCADDERVLELIEEIPEQKAFLSQALTELVKNFRLDLLLDLAQHLAPT